MMTEKEIRERIKYCEDAKIDERKDFGELRLWQEEASALKWVLESGPEKKEVSFEKEVRFGKEPTWGDKTEFETTDEETGEPVTVKVSSAPVFNPLDCDFIISGKVRDFTSNVAKNVCWQLHITKELSGGYLGNIMWSVFDQKISKPKEKVRGLPFYDEANGVEWGKEVSSVPKEKKEVLAFSPKGLPFYLEEDLDDKKCYPNDSYSLSEVADLMEKIQKQVALAEFYRNGKVFPSELKSKWADWEGYVIAKDSAPDSHEFDKFHLDWPLLFRERSDLVEKIRKEAN